MAEDELSRKLARKDSELVSRKILDQTIVVPIRGQLADMQAIYAMNPVAEFIWRQLDGRRSLSEVLEAILKEFDIERPAAEADLLAFIRELTEASLVTSSERPE